MKAFTGTGVALVTPFRADLSVDTGALARLVQEMIANGIDYLVVLGTTAESAVLSAAEKQLVIDTVIEANQQKLRLVLGVGGNHTDGITAQLDTTDLSAFSAVLSVAPYYNRPTQEGIFRHFLAVAEAAPLPVILYNVPSRTGVNMSPDTVIRLADHPNIIGIKEAAGDLVQAMRMIDGTPDDFLVISGDDMMTLPMVLAGGAGVISVVAQGFPEAFSSMVTHGLKGEVQAAYDQHYRLMSAMDYLFEQGNPAGVKALLNAQGLMEEAVRLPLVNVDEELRSRIRGLLA